MMGLALHAFALLLGGSQAADAPIVGVLTVPAAHGCETARTYDRVKDATNGGISCFASLYVKYVEAAGGRVVPILYDWDDQQLAKAFASVNAVLFTGGGVQIAHPSSSPPAAQYLRAASLLFNLTLRASSAGESVPLWGTCMGLQTLSVVAAGTSVLETNSFDSENMSLPLELTQAAATSKLLGPQVPSNILRWLTTENITTNLHHDGVVPASFTRNQRLASLFSVLSTNRDRTGKTFVSTIEGKDHPIYGVQWHPERPIFEWGADESGINHGRHAIEAMQYFANFFIAEARKNSHHFESKADEESALIYNYVPQGRSSYQVYLFDSGNTAEPSQANHVHDAALSHVHV